MEYFAHSQKEFVYKYVVLLSDVDQFKHMSFANYLKLMFLATDALLIKCQNADFLCHYKLKLEASRMQFRKQTIAGDNTLIKVNASGLSQGAFNLLYTFIIEGSGDLVGLGKQSYQLYDIKTSAPTDLTNVLRETLVPIAIDENNMLYKY